MVVGCETRLAEIKTARDQESVSFGYTILTSYMSYSILWVETNCFARIFCINGIDTLYSEKSKSFGVTVLLQQWPYVGDILSPF
jgi:hypothetical protein